MTNNTNKMSNQTSYPSIIFIDRTVADYQSLIAGVQIEADVVLLDPTKNGVAQITAALAKRAGISSIQIVSHGSAGSLRLGSGTLNGENLASFSSQIQLWRKALTEKADILLYGCYVAAGKVGRAFVRTLSQLSGATVAASTNLTGNSTLGGDWNLEFSTGLIKTPLAFNSSTLASYNGVLGEVHFNVSSVFNVDGIVNRTANVTDSTQNAIDTTNNALITQSFASFSQTGGVGLPDNGIFAANGFRPNIDLQYDNANDGNNIRLINTSTGSFNFPVTAGIYSDIHIAALSTEGSSDIRLVFTYSDNSTAATSVATVPDWYSNITESTSLYYLIDNMDRASTSGTFQDANAPALFGLRFVNPNSSKTVTNITVEKTTSTGYLAFLGATGIDNIAPTVALTSAAAATVNAPFAVTATFSESTTNFISSDLSVTNGTVNGFSGSGTTYTFTVTPTSQGTVTVNVPAGVATDAAANNNTAATSLTRTFDSLAPTVSLTSAAASTVNAPFAVTATFSESTTNFISSDLSVTNGTVSGFSGSGTTYTFTVTPTSQGTVTVNVPAGIATDTVGNNNTAATALTRTFDTTAPTLTSITPADNATSIAVNANLVVNFSEAVQKGTGNIVIKKVSDNSVVETIAVTGGNVTVSGSQLTINPTADLAQSTDYYIEIANGAIKDLTGNNFAGITGATTWNFTTADTIPTTVQFDFTSVFDRDVMINYTGGVTDPTQTGLSSWNETLVTESFALLKAGGSGGLPDNGFFAANAFRPDVQLGYSNSNNGNNAKVLTTNGTSFTFNVTPNQYSQIHLFATGTNGSAGMQVTFNYSDGTTQTSTATVFDWFDEINSESFSSYYLIDGMDRSLDTTGTNYDNVNDPAIFGFGFNPNPAKTLQSVTVTKTSGVTNNWLGVFGATGVLESTPPTITSITPADNATSIAVNANLVVNFSEAVQKGTGNIVIKKVSDNSVVETIAVTGGNVTVSGSQLTINPVNDLAQNTDYYIEIANGAIKDLTGNNFVGITGGTTWNFTTADTTAPDVPVITNISSDSGTAGDRITNDPTLSISGTAEANSTVNLFNNGTSIGSTNTDATGNWTFDYTGTTLADGIYNFTATATDTATNTSNFSAPFNVTVDTTAPTVTINQDAGQPDPTAGSTVNFAVVFSETITGFDGSDITLGGTAGATTATVTGSGNTYNVAVTGMSSPGTVTAAVNVGAATDAAGNTSASSTSSDNEITYNNTVPTVTNITRADADPSNASTVNYTVTFSENVTGVDASDFTLAAGSIVDAAITNLTGTGNTYTIAVNTGTSDGTVQLNLNDDDTIVNSLNIPLGGVGTGNGNSTGQIYTIDKTGVSVTNITSTLADGNYTVGQVIPITITFGEAVNVTGTPQLSLNNGGSAGYATGTGTNTLTFNYTVGAGESASDLDAIALLLAGGTIKDSVGNDATLTLPAAGAASSLGANKNIVIDTTPAGITSLNSTQANGNYSVGTIILIAVTFDKVVNVTGTPEVTLNSGGKAIYSAGSGTNALTFNYTVAAGQSSADLEAIALTLAGGTIKDSAGNNAGLTLPTPGAVSSLGGAKNIAIDTSVPSVSTVTSSLANGNYPIGQVIPIAVNFSETVNVTGTPRLSLNNGGNATYASGSGTNSLIFNYTVAAGQNTADLDYASATALALNGGTIRDTAGNNATLTLTAPGAASSLGGAKNIAIDGIIPTTTTFTPADNTTSVDVDANLVVAFSEAVQKGTGNIFIKKVSDNSVVETINVTSTNVTVSGSTVTINPTTDLAETTPYYVEITNGAIKDLAGNNYAGIAGATPWNFTTTDSKIDNWLELDAYLKNQKISVPDAAKSVLQELIGKVNPLTVEYENNELTVTYDGEVDFSKFSVLPLVTKIASDLTIPISEPSLTISELNTSTPTYKLAGKVNFEEEKDGGDTNFLDFINEQLKIKEIELETEITTETGQEELSVTANLSTQKLTLLNAGDLWIELTGAQLNITAAAGTSLPTFGIGGSVSIKGYDPFQANEPELKLSGKLVFDPKSITSALQLESKDPWKTPFGLPNSEIRNLALQVGGTYITPWIDNVGFVGDLKFGNFDLKSAFFVSSTEPKDFAVELTANNPINIVDLWTGPVSSYLINQVGNQVNFVKRAESFLKQTLDVNIVSVDSSDADTEIDPLLKLVPVNTEIADTELKQGLGINGQVRAWGKTATLSLNANPYDVINPSLEGFLQIPEVDLGFLKLTGADGPTDKTLDFAVKVSPTEQYLKGDGRLDLLGTTVAKANVEFTSTSAKVKDFDLNLGVLALDINDLSVDINNKTASGSGSVKLLGREIAGAKINADSNGLKVQGNLDLFGVFSIENALIDVKSATDIKIGGTAKIFGQNLANADISIQNGKLNVTGGIGIDLPLIGRVGANLTITSDGSLSSSKIKVGVSGGALGKVEYELLNLAPLKSIEDVFAQAADKAFGVGAQFVNQAIDAVVTGFNSATSAVLDTINQVGKFFENLATSAYDAINNEILERSSQNQSFGNGNDWFDARGQDDTVRGGYGNDHLIGGWGPDLIEGQQDNDIVEGNSGLDYLYGNEGNDWLEGGAHSDFIYGGSGNDLIYGSGIRGDNGQNDASDWLYGEGGNDKIHGGDGNDVLDSGVGDDHLSGDNGNDQIFGRDGYDVLNGGSGNDSLYGEWNDDRLYGDTGNDYLDGGWGNDEIHGYHDRDTLVGYGGRDILYGQQGGDLIQGGDDNDLIYGEDNGKQGQSYDGNDDHDTLYGESGNDYVFGGLGNDNLYGGDGSDYLDGGDGNDTLRGEVGIDLLDGGNGNDNLDGGDGNDKLYGREGNDIFFGLQGNDYLDGGNGNDTLYSHEGDDILEGQAGNDHLASWVGSDILNGGEGNDSLYGEGDNDTLSGGNGSNVLDGGNENDTADYRFSSGAVNVNLNNGNATFSGNTDRLTSIENVIGSVNNDTVVGNGGNNTLSGQAGNDGLFGESGNDLLKGEEGNDEFHGWEGNDTLEGGTGNDTLFGQQGDDFIQGGDGKDALYGEGNGSPSGSSSNDTLSGGAGDDSLFGGEGNDYLDSGEGNDTINGGSGTDTLLLAGNKENYQFTETPTGWRIVALNGDVKIVTGVENFEFKPKFIDFDFSSVFDRDVIVNHNAGATDSTQDGLSSGNEALITQSFASFKNNANGNGLPDSGFFRANAFSPNVQLGYNKTNDGKNAKVLTANNQSFTFNVTPNNYSEIHLFATSTNGEAGMQVTFKYSDGTTGTSTASVPDWFDEIPTPSFNRYYLIDGMDRSLDTTGSNYQDANDPAIFGFGFKPNPAKTLQSITVNKTSGATNNWLGVFGGTGVLPTPGTQTLNTDSVRKYYKSRVIDGYIANGKIFFDANLNGALDENEPFTITLADGSFDLNVEVEKFDTNQNGELDYTEGKFILMGGMDILSGIDAATGLLMATPLTSTLNSTVVTPLTTIIAELVQQGIDPATAETNVKTALGLPSGVDLGSYDPLEAIAKGDTQGVSVFGSMIQVQNTIVQMAKFIEGVSKTEVAQLAFSGISAIANQTKSSTAVDLGKAETIQAILQSAITQAAQSDPQINPTQVAATAAAAAQIMALGNQMVGELVASGRPIKDIATDITKLQAVSVGQVAVGLSELAAGTVSVEEFLANNTKEAILARMATVQVNDPTVRPEVKAIDSSNSDTLPSGGSDNSNGGSTNNPGSDSVPAASDNDLIIGTPQKDYLNGYAGNDSIFGASDDDQIYGGLHNDLMNGNQGNDFLNGNQGNDTVFGGQGHDLVHGGQNDDLLCGDKGNDTVFGDLGNDTAYGGVDNDLMNGNKGDDILNGNQGNDTVFGGQGNDLVYGGQDNDELYGSKGNDTVVGDKGDDLLFGNQDNDLLNGGAGNDTLYGGKENDTLIGGVGDDLISGDLGDDTLTGGEGVDRFLLSVAQGSDVITDFTNGVDLFALSGGLTFNQLSITAGNGSTLISVGNQLLATVNGVQSTVITADDFTVIS